MSARQVLGKCMGRHSLSKAPRAREHILTDSWNCHKYLLQCGVQVGEWGERTESGHKWEERVGSVTGYR